MTPRIPIEKPEFVLARWHDRPKRDVLAATVPILALLPVALPPEGSAAEGRTSGDAIAAAYGERLRTDKNERS